MEKSLWVISLSHEAAGLEVREKFSLTSQQKERVYTQLREIFGFDEVIILSTCNRFEVYYYDELDRHHRLIRFVCSLNSLDASEYLPLFVSYRSNDAIQHLFQVAMGLKSQVPGDQEIYGQVKSAYQMSVDQGMSGVYMNRLLHKVFFCHKSVNQNTNFKNGASSVSYTAVSLIERTLCLPLNTKILIIGAGKMGGDVCRHLVKRGFSNLSVSNRTDGRAYELTEECQVSFVPHYRHREDMRDFEVIISAVSSSEVVYSVSDLLVSNVKVMIDMSAPRSIDQDVQSVGIQLFNLDSLGKIVDEVVRSRQKEIPHVLHEIDLAVAEFNDWVSTLSFTDQVKRFKETLEEIRRQSLASVARKMSADQQILAEEVTQKMIQKIVNLPAITLRSACKRGNVEELSDSLNELFNVSKRVMSNHKSIIK